MPHTDAPIEIDTRFGAVTAPATSVVTFTDGVPGFEKCRRFVLASLAAIDPFTCLQGLDDPRPSFLAIDPRAVVEDYQPSLSGADRRRLEADDHDPLVWLALVRAGDDAAT